MAFWGNLAGTVTGYLRLGLSGVRIKDSAGTLAVRNAGDTAAAPLTASLVTADLVPTNGPFAHRNKIINGNFDIWQRGISQTSYGYGSVDRWSIQSNGSTKTFSRQTFALGQTDVPGGPTYFSRIVVTSAAGAGNYALNSQPIENVRTLAGKNATISFWAKADAAKNIAIEFMQDFGTGGTPSARVNSIASQLIPLTTVWQKFTRTVAIPSIAGKTLGTDNNDWLGINFWFDAGTTYATRAANLGQQSGTFDIAQVQIEEGSVATPFEQRPIGYELSLCQRYYEKSYSQSTFAGTATSEGMVQEWVVSGVGNYQSSGMQFKTKKRALPTIIIYSTTTGVAGMIHAVAANADKASTLEGIGEGGASPYFALTAADLVRYHWTASAEL